MIMRHSIRNFLIWTVLLLLVAWSFIQLIRLKADEPEQGDALQLLYHVSAFQFELMANALQDAVNAPDSEHLNELRQAVYTASYTHEHLVLAVGKHRLTELQSLTDFMQYILRLQMGGNRPLKSSERETLQLLNNTVQKMQAEYRALFTRSGDMISSRHEEMMKLDETLRSQLATIKY